MDSNTQPPPLPTEPRKPLGCLPYAIGGASFIPLVGVVFGLIAIVWGITRRAWQLVALGACGILFTIVIYSALFYFGYFHRGGMFDELRSRLAVTMLNDCVKEIEFYKLQRGHYPAGLSELDPKDKTQLAKCFDPTIIDINPKRDRHFFYQLDPSGSSYFFVPPVEMVFHSRQTISFPPFQKMNVRRLDFDCRNSRLTIHLRSSVKHFEGKAERGYFFILVNNRPTFSQRVNPLFHRVQVIADRARGAHFAPPPRLGHPVVIRSLWISSPR